MKLHSTVLVLLIVLAAINYSIVQKERQLSSGTRMYLALAPVDPRSLMQGDYMQLRYELAELMPDAEYARQGALVVALDEMGIASFVRLHGSEELRPGEHLLRYHRRGVPYIGAESFFFEEGQAERYEAAAFAELRVDAAGKSVLVALCDAELQRIEVE
jgi:uncharacterized membrane-anchored protein